MKSLFENIKTIAGENRNVILLGIGLTLYLAFYFISWHVTIISLGSFYSVLDAAESFVAQSARYLVFSAIAASAVCAIMLFLKRPLAKKIFIGVLLFLFFCTEFIRMFDWGALYFSGNHVDANFWTHAFYSDSTTFLFTMVSIAIYLAVILFFFGMFYLLKQLYIHTGNGERP
ncbi:MAG: hypothetical protein JW807_07860 [Spirochaetes bacterium]|nr:hypothetical protein [Spirochaetota bacterium]